MSEISVATLVDRDRLVALAGLPVYLRGVDYYTDHRVELVDLLPRRVTAWVAGTSPYEVELSVVDEGLTWSCTCPYADGGSFCKHAVAVALNCRAPCSEPEPGAPSDAELRAALLRQPPAMLVGLLLEEAAGNPPLAARLATATAGDTGASGAGRGSPGSVDLRPFVALLDDALTPYDDFISYREVPGVASRIEKALEELTGLYESGYAPAVVDLAEHALRGFEELLGRSDDSDGYLNGLLRDAQDLHLTACAEAVRSGDLDPVELAERLSAWELSSNWEVFLGAGVTYAEVLGEAGLARYRALAARAWEQLAPRGPGEGPAAEGYGHRFRITAMMEALAGDLDELIAVRSRDLSSAYDFLRIAEACREAGEDDRALEWAERGVRSFEPRCDGRLQEFLAEEYQRRGRHGEALDISWGQLVARPSLETYQRLRERTERAGEWPAWRSRALDALRPAAGGSRSALVEVLLWEDEPDAAWAEAGRGGCTPPLWLRLADARKDAHPLDAAAVYRDRVEPTIALANNHAYEQAVGLLRQLRECLAAAGQPGEFTQAVADIRATHKRKRNLMALLERAGW